MAAAELAAISPSELATRQAAGLPRVSVVIPARDEGARITGVLAELSAAVRRPAEILVVVDSAADSTVAALRARTGTAGVSQRVSCLRNGYGTGPASAIRFGIDHAVAPVIVVMMADGCDDPAQIDVLAQLVEDGAVLAAASRYTAGGSQRGGPFLKRTLSRLAGTSLAALAGAGTCDATNSFKAYSAAFVRQAGLESRHGFTAGIELTAKARRLRLPVAEVPTSWQERRAGGSSAFRLIRWLPAYLRWYLYCFGPARSMPAPAGRER